MLPDLNLQNNIDLRDICKELQSDLDLQYLYNCHLVLARLYGVPYRQFWTLRLFLIDWWLRISGHVWILLKFLWKKFCIMKFNPPDYENTNFIWFGLKLWKFIISRNNLWSKIRRFQLIINFYNFGPNHIKLVFS